MGGKSSALTPLRHNHEQEDLQESLRGPQFNLDSRYGEHLNIIYVTLLISSGVPVSGPGSACAHECVGKGGSMKALAILAQPACSLCPPPIVLVHLDSAAS